MAADPNTPVGLLRVRAQAMRELASNAVAQAERAAEQAYDFDRAADLLEAALIAEARQRLDEERNR